MHTDQSRWLEGQARGQQGGCGARPGASGAGVLLTVVTEKRYQAQTEFAPGTILEVFCDEVTFQEIPKSRKIHF